MADRPATATPALSRRTKSLLVLAAVVLVVLLGGARLVDVYVDWAWFGEVGFRGVFSTILFTRVVQFVLGALLLGGLLAVNLYIAYRVRPVFVPVAGPEDPVARYRTVVLARLRWFAIGVPAVVALIAGLSAQADWQTTQLFLNATPFGQADPVFRHDISFYVFELPFYRWLLSWLFVAIAVSFVASLVAHYIFGGIRLAGRNGTLAGATRAHLAVLAGTFVLFKAVAYFFDRYELLFSDRKAAVGGANFFGASYTDLNAAMPAKVILLIVAVICAGAFFAAVVLRNLQIPAIALALLILASVLVGAAYPAILEQFSVRPNAIDREQTSITNNIAATRNAFGLTDVAQSTVPYGGAARGPDSPAAPVNVANSQVTLQNLRIQDPSRLTRTFAGQPGLTNFYAFPDPLDIDRYATPDGQTNDYVLGVRDLNPDGLRGNQQDWFNRHLVYTHGNGMLYAPADRVDQPANAQSSQGGLPAFQNSDVRTPGPFNVTPNGARTYFGEFLGGDDDYAIVGGAPNARGREFDGQDNPQTNYDGPAGVPIGSAWSRLVFAAAYGERNILFNGQIGQDSRILYHRTPEERVAKVAPWLRQDSDPYPAVIGDDPNTPVREPGHIEWIIDGYTTLPRYPNAQQLDIGNATTDSLRPDGAAGGQVGYMRNSVKATVDAYTGAVKLYQVDDQDPVLKTWMQTFPGVVTPSNQVPASLRDHFRYPEDLFKVQRDLITRYHVSDPRDFFSTLNFWTVPPDPNPGSEPIPPFYILGGDPRPGAPQRTQFQMTSTLLALSRPNLAAYLSVSSEPGSYGRMTVLQLPIGNQGDTDAQGGVVGLQGPQQVQGQLQANAEVRQALLPLTQAGTAVQYGNLLTLPVAGGLLYVEPIYVERSGGSTFPQLLGVIARFNNGNVGWDSTLQGALTEAFAGVTLPPGLSVPGAGGSAPAPLPSGVPDQSGIPGPPAGLRTLTPELSSSADAMADAINRLADARARRDYAGIGQAEADLDAATRRFLAARSGSQPTG